MVVLVENDEIDNDMEDYRNKDCLIPVGNRSRINFGFNASFTNLQDHADRSSWDIKPVTDAGNTIFAFELFY